jgi:hypothetical protein
VIVTELRQPLAVATPLGPGDAILVETGAADQLWTVILKNCAIVTFPQSEIRAARSYTHGRISHEEMGRIVEAETPAKARRRG